MKSFFGRAALLLSVSLAASVCFAAQADTKVACVGNSLTYGYGLSSPYYESYPTRLDTLLGAGYEVTNFGVSGKTMIKAVNDAYWSQSAFASARAYLPAIVVIELGTNDSKDYIWPYYKQDFKADYASMIDTFRVLSSKPQVWVTLQPRANNATWNMYDTTIANQVNPAILAVAMQKAAPVIDLRTGMAGHPGWYQDDSVHPNAVGAKAMAGIISDMLKRTPVAISDLGGGMLWGPCGFGCRWYRNDTLLAGDSTSTLAVTKPGSYRISSKVDSESQSRLVSAPFATSATVGVGAARQYPSVHVFLASDNSLQIQDPAMHGVAVLRAWNSRGEAVALTALKPGVYHYRVSGSGFRNFGRVVVP